MSVASADREPSRYDLWSQIAWRAALCGVLGTVTGLALFIDLRDNTATAWIAWLLGLATAAAVSFFIDALRVNPNDSAHGPASRFR